MAEFVQKTIRQAMKDGTVPSMPDRVTFFGHFIRGDLASFSDFWAHKREFRGLGKTLVSGWAGHKIEMAEAPERPQPADDDPDAGCQQSRSEQVTLRTLDGRRYLVSVRFVDTIKLTPGQRGLAYAAAMVGRRKLDLHADLGIPVAEAAERAECAGMGLPARYGKERMDLVMRDFPEQMHRRSAKCGRSCSDVCLGWFSAGPLPGRDASRSDIRFKAGPGPMLLKDSAQRPHSALWSDYALTNTSEFDP
jgi:hypothetical protein